MTKIGNLTQDPSDQEWSSARKLEVIQEGQERFVLDTRVLLESVVDTIIAGQASYNLPADLLDINRMAHSGVRLSRLSKYDLDWRFQSDWSAVPGTPKSYYVNLEPDNKTYTLFPIPQDADAGPVLSLEYVQIPPDMDDDADLPWNGHTLMTPYSMAIAYWGASALMKENPNEVRIAKIRLYDDQYSRLVSHCIETFKSLADTVPIRLRGGRYFKGL